MQMSLADHGVPDWMDFEGLDTLLDDLACDFSLFDNFAGDASYRQSPSSGTVHFVHMSSLHIHMFISCHIGMQVTR
jgi:hypothetical protein